MAGRDLALSEFRKILGWPGTTVPQENDIGTDIWFHVTDEQLFDHKQLLGAQVKSTEQAEEYESLDSSWIIYTDAEHADYWLTYKGVRHLMIFVDLPSNAVYWAHINDENCRPCKPRKNTQLQGYRIAIPKANRLQVSQREELLAIATSTKYTTTYSGRAFTTLADVPPMAKLRVAMLVPKLMAPHPNRGKIEGLEPEHFIALIVKADFFSINRQLFESEFWKSLGDKPDSADWRWLFAHALIQTLFDSTNRFEDLLTCLQSALRSDLRAAAIAALTARYYEYEMLNEAFVLLEQELAREEFEPIDRAWLLLHRCRVSADLGEISQALADAKQSYNLLNTAASPTQDPSSTLLLSIAIRMQRALSSLDEVFEMDLATLINSRDIEAVWWQRQQHAWALD